MGCSSSQQFSSKKKLQMQSDQIENKKTDKFNFIMQLTIIGNSGVGKTFILKRFEQQERFNPEQHTKLQTLGVDFITKVIDINNQKVKLHIWDTAGQEKFQSISQQFYKRADGIIVAYAVDDRVSFENVENWMKNINEKAKQNVLVFLIGNKIDIDSDLSNQHRRVISKEEGQKLADKFKVQFLETSAFKNININEVILQMTSQIMKKYPDIFTFQKLSQNQMEKLVIEN